jgi:hypothetical protein
MVDADRAGGARPLNGLSQDLAGDEDSPTSTPLAGIDPAGERSRSSGCCTLSKGAAPRR